MVIRTSTRSVHAPLFALAILAALAAGGGVRSQDIELRAQLVQTFTGALFPSTDGGQQQKPIEVGAPPRRHRAALRRLAGGAHLHPRPRR